MYISEYDSVRTGQTLYINEIWSYVYDEKEYRKDYSIILWVSVISISLISK